MVAVIGAERRSVVDGIAERIERAIMEGDLALGARITEHGLAERLGVSRGPLREALRRLEGRHLIVRTHNVGARVASITPGDLSNMLTIREGLEGMAARLAAQNMTPGEIERLQAIVLTQSEKRIRNQYSPDYQTPGLDFHMEIARGARNPLLYDLIYGDSFSLLRIFRYRSSALPGRTTVAIAEHRAVAAAIAAGDPDTAEMAMRHHLRRSHANMLENLAPLGFGTPDGDALPRSPQLDPAETER